MKYASTRGNENERVTSAVAITKGLSDDGGLYVPLDVPVLSADIIQKLGKASYSERAYEIFRLFLTDFSDDEIKNAVNCAYNDKNFDSDKIAEISRLSPEAYVLELWHGPTCAFKDMALQILPYLLTESAKKTAGGKKIAILVATSGDTGKAALDGFKDVKDTHITVFYPEDGVSMMQKRQMTTQEGSNVAVCAVKGNFDDCQTGVKSIFTSAEINKKLNDENYMFSSANSINWGRLAPQIIYYISTYAELAEKGEIELGEKLNFVVPTGNFGNILAAYYAKKMGVPIGKLICASNSNNILTDFINTGTYNRNRKFITTISPSMDILISSNLERLLYHLSETPEKVKKWFVELSEKGYYSIDNDVKAKIKDIFYGGYCDDDSTKQTIKDVFDKYSYLIDTHTAVAYNVYEKYKSESGDNTKTVIVSTASPYKFGVSVSEALGIDCSGDEFDVIGRLEEATGVKIPKSLSETKEKPVRFDKTIDSGQMPSYVLGEVLGVRS